MNDAIPVAELRRRYPYVFAWGREQGSTESFMIEQARAAYLDGQREDVLCYADWEHLEPSARDAILSVHEQVGRGALPAPAEYATLSLARPDAVPYRVWWRVAKLGGARRERIERHVRNMLGAG